MRRFFCRHFEDLMLPIFTLAALGLAWPVLGDFGNRMLTTAPLAPGLPAGDQGFFLWALWWIGEAASRGIHPWFCDIQGAPGGVSLIYTTLVPLLGWLSIPLRAAGMNLIAIFNFWVILAFALLPWFTLLVARQWGVSRPAALMAALMLWLPPFQRDHIGVLNLVSAWWVPAVYYCWLRWIRTNSPRWAALAGLAMAGCFYTSAYHTIHAVVLTGLDGAWRLWGARGPALRRHDRSIKPGAALFGALCFVLLSIDPDIVLILLLLGAGAAALALARDLQSRASAQWRRRIAGAALGGMLTALAAAPFFWVKLTDPRLGAAQLADSLKWKFYWAAQPLSFFLNDTLADWICRNGVFGWDAHEYHILRSGDFNIFPGYAVWALVALAALAGRPWKRGGWRLLAWAAVFATLALGPFLRWGIYNVEASFTPDRLIVMPATLFEGLPLLNGYRVWARMGNWMFFTLALFAALGFDRAMLRLGMARWRWAMAILAGLAVIAERTPSTPVHFQSVEIPAFYERLAESPEPLTIVEFPNDGGMFLHPQTIHRKSLVNQYTSRTDEMLKKRMETNAFFWMVFTYNVKQYFIEDQKMTPPAADFKLVCAGCEALAPDAIIVHPGALQPGDYAQFRSICERLGFSVEFESPQVSYFVHTNGTASSVSTR